MQYQLNIYKTNLCYACQTRQFIAIVAHVYSQRRIVLIV